MLDLFMHAALFSFTLVVLKFSVLSSSAWIEDHFILVGKKMSSIVPVCVKLNRKDIPINCSNIVLVINSFIMLQYKAIIWGLKKREFCKFSMVLAIWNNVLTLWWILNYQLVPCVIGNIPRPYLAK